MLKTMLLGAALAIGMSSIASASILPVPVGSGQVGIVKVAQGCGPGFSRGPHGGCHPMAMHHACPRGFHMGPDHRRCRPN